MVAEGNELGNHTWHHCRSAQVGGADPAACPGGLSPHFPGGRVLRVTVEGGTLSQGGRALAWDPHRYYEVSLDAGSLAWKSETAWSPSR